MRAAKNSRPPPEDVDRWIVDEIVWLLRRFDPQRMRRLLAQAASRLGVDVDALSRDDSSRHC